MEVSLEVYNTTERHLEVNVSGMMDFLRNFPSAIMAEDVILTRTAPNAVFYNISLLGLGIPLQAYTVHLETVQCTDVLTGRAIHQPPSFHPSNPPFPFR